MTINFFDLVEPKKEVKKPQEVQKNKPVEVKQENTTKDTKASKTSTNGKGTAKKEVKEEVKYKYPFNFYNQGSEIDITNYGFEDGKEYTEKEITKMMLMHRHYDFAGEMTYSMIEEDNMLVATAKQYKKG